MRAALRAYVETNLAKLDPLQRHRSAVAFRAAWTGDLQRGALNNDDACGSYEVVAWNEEGVVGLAYEIGWGRIEQFELSVEAVTGGPDDVRGAVPGLPAQLESALVLATSLLIVGWHGQREAGIGFWLHGDRVEGTLFDDPDGPGATRLAAWGMLRDYRLPRAQHARVVRIGLEPEAATDSRHH